LTSYVFRHTWASEAYRCHVEIRVISQALGHTTEKMTRNYLARLAPEEIIKANEKVSHKIEKLIGKEARPYFINKVRQT
ncbi:tyrosine-type recombinase/integrase, partial [uncultured Parabacteroides sp.]|uniref:tyrosine-type recombinase/integrase n=1 Tax=uncultured Parabacteroides sp. TaxID=512312 RepID=UPI0025FFE81A